MEDRPMSLVDIVTALAVVAAVLVGIGYFAGGYYRPRPPQPPDEEHKPGERP
jgi:hypothetical protein